MAQRELNPELKALYDSGKQVYSISKANTIDQCLYQAYLTYVKKAKGKQQVYGICGTKVHDTLEMIMKGEAEESALLSAIDEEIEAMDLIGISFPKDRLGGDSIRNNWLINMRHFATHFVRPVGTFEEEQFVLYPLSDQRYVQGYIDLIRVIDHEKKIVEVYDWKTSSQFSDKDLIHHGRQLVFYSLALERMGYTVRKAAWIMLKYVKVSFMGKAKKNSKEKSLITKVLERRQIGKMLEPYLRADLEEMGYDIFSIDEIIDSVIRTNEVPPTLRNSYKIIPYVRTYEITDELRQECIRYLNNSADRFEACQRSGDWPEMKIDKGNEFFCSVLCNHGDKCPFLKDYLDKMNPTDDFDDLF